MGPVGSNARMQDLDKLSVGQLGIFGIHLVIVVGVFFCSCHKMKPKLLRSINKHVSKKPYGEDVRRIGGKK